MSLLVINIDDLQQHKHEPLISNNLQTYLLDLKSMYHNNFDISISQGFLVITPKVSLTKIDKNCNEDYHSCIFYNSLLNEFNSNTDTSGKPTNKAILEFVVNLLNKSKIASAIFCQRQDTPQEDITHNIDKKLAMIDIQDFHTVINQKLGFFLQEKNDIIGNC